MKKSKKKITIIRSEHPELRSMGPKYTKLLLEALSTGYENVTVLMINNQSDISKLKDLKPNLVIVGMKNLPLPKDKFDDSITPVALLEKLKINFAGSKDASRSIGRQKELAKEVMKKANIPTAGYFMAKPDQYRTGNNLPLKFPLFIKPPHRGQGLGIDADSVARNFKEYESKVKSIHKLFNSKSLVEQYLNGREFTVAIMEHENGQALNTMPVELIAAENDRGDRILGSRIKNEDNESVLLIAEPHIKKVVIALAESVFRQLGARDYARVDIRMSDAGTAYFIEANLSPGLGHGYFTRAFSINTGVGYDKLICRICDICMNKNRKLLN